MKKIILTTIVAIGVLLAPIFAADNAQFGIIDVQLIMQKSPKIKAAGDKLKAKFSSQQNKIMAKQQELKGLLDKFNRDSSIMSDSVKKKLQDQIMVARKNYTTMTQRYEQNLMMAQQQEMQKIADQVQNIVSKIAKKDQLKMVFLKHALVYTGDAKDVTDEVLRAMK